MRRNDRQARAGAGNLQTQPIANPDEIVIAFDDDEMETPEPNTDEITVDRDEIVDAEPSSKQVQSTGNPNEIVTSDDLDDVDVNADDIVHPNDGVIDINQEISKEVPTASMTDVSQTITTPHDELMNETTEKIPMLDPAGKLFKLTEYPIECNAHSKLNRNKDNAIFELGQVLAGKAISTGILTSAADALYPSSLLFYY
jgi:hypothetical protein